MFCATCQSYRMRRIKREGFLRLKVAPLFGYYPWRCSVCGTVRLLKARGVRKRTRKADPQQVESASMQNATRSQSA